ncbi:MAG: zinc ribbon domain-containing protein [Candidatus Heimdallarchaeaceae archaeon]
MSNYPISRRLLSRMITSIIMMILLYVVFGITIGFNKMNFYVGLIVIYLIIMILRYIKIRNAEKLSLSGDTTKGVPRINPATHRYPNGLGQPTTVFYQNQNQKPNYPVEKLENTAKEFCKNCGAELPFDASFCENCGAKRH